PSRIVTKVVPLIGARPRRAVHQRGPCGWGALCEGLCLLGHGPRSPEGPGGACGHLAPVGADDHSGSSTATSASRSPLGAPGCSMPTSSCSRSDTLVERSGGWSCLLAVASQYSGPSRVIASSPIVVRS